MFVLGVLAIITGAILTIVGFAMNNSLEAQLISAFSTGSTNPGTIFIVIGIILLVVGVLLVVMKKKKAQK